jgi:hypothetical protein
MILPPILYCWWLKKKWKVLTLRPPKKYFFFGTVGGVLLAAILLWGHMLQGSLFSPIDKDGDFTTYAFGAASDRASSVARRDMILNQWKDSYVKAHAGLVKPRDLFFLPWLLGFGGLGFAFFKDWVSQKLNRRNKELELLQQVEDQQREAELASQLKTRNSNYHDLESALVYYSKRAQRIEGLDLDEDEKEMLLMRLQEKKETAMEQYV